MKFLRKDMVENISAHFPQQGILGLEMGIEGASPDIRLIKYLLDSDIVKMFLFQQLTKCLKDRTPCFQLSSVRDVPADGTLCRPGLRET
jgi:hypothetical protein